MCFEKKFTPHSQLLSSASSLVQESLMQHTSIEQDTLHHRWVKPKPGIVSIHVDAGVGMDGKAGFGIIIRDSECRILAAQSGPLQRNISVEQPELQSLTKELVLARDLSIKKIQIFTDSRLAFNRIVSKEKDCSLLSPLVHHIRQMSNEFQYFKCGFTRRQGNVPAHLLAKIGLPLCNSINWASKPPNDVILAVSSDRVCFNE